MINTSAFESLKRYQLLDQVRDEIVQNVVLHPYSWMLPYLNEAIAREISFMENNKDVWLMDTQIRKNETLNRPIEETRANENQKTNGGERG